ncbi:MAG TPA: hypothetical protein VF142_09415 [Longimicrobium sp.]
MADDFRTVVKGRWGTLSYAEGRLIQFLSGLAIAPAHPGDGNGDGRRVRHDMVPWLLVEQQAHVRMRRALVVDDAEFDEPLDLSFCTCEYPLRFRNCVFRQGLNVDSAHVCQLEIVGGTVHGLHAASLNVDVDLVLGAEGKARTEVVGEVRLTDARIGRNLRVQNVTLRGDAGVALRADRIRVSGNVEMAGRFTGQDGKRKGGLSAVGALRFVGARIEGTFNANGARLRIVPPPALPPAAPRSPGYARREVLSVRPAPDTVARVPLPPREAAEEAETCGLNLEGARVDGDVYLKGIRCIGEVRLVGAIVGDTVDLRGARIHGVDSESLTADRLKTGGTLFLRFARLRGLTLMQGASIGGSVDMRGAQLDGRGTRTRLDIRRGYALQADRLHVRGHLYMSEGFRALGRVDVSYATIQANWVCQDCGFVSAVGAGVPVPAPLPGAPANDLQAECLAAVGAVVEGRLELREGFLSCGVVRLTGISVHQDASLEHANFQCLTAKVSDRAKGVSLRMERADVRGDLSLEHSYVDGGVRLSGARVRGSLRFNGAWLDTRPAPIDKRVGLDVRRVQVGGEMTFCGATLECNIILRAAQVQGMLGFDQATFVGPARVDARFMRMRGTLVWRRVRLFNPVVVDLSDATLGCIEDDGAEGWPRTGNLLMDGCTYASINSDGIGARDRLAWLARQDKPQLPQPYEQLATALRRDGHVVDARKVLRARENAGRPRFARRPHAWLGNVLMDLFVGHGYRLAGVLIATAVMLSLGTAVFDHAYDTGGMLETQSRVRVAPTRATLENQAAALRLAATTGTQPARTDSARAYPRFHPFVYSVDAFLPIIELQQEKYWLPGGNGRLRLWYWFHVVAGWVCSTFLVLGVTAMVKKDP